MGDALVTTQRLADGAAVVEVRGSLETATVGALRSVLLDAIETWRPRELVVDMRRVSFMDSVGIGTLVVGSNAARTAGGVLVVRNPSPFVHRLLHITGLTELFGLDAFAEERGPDGEHRSAGERSPDGDGELSTGRR